MKILVVLPSLDEKGPVIVAQLLAKYSENTNISYIFCSLRNNSIKSKKYYSDLGISVIEVNMNKYPKLKDMKKINSIVNSVKPDIIHAHTFWPTFLSAMTRKGIPKIVTVHNNPIEDYTFEYGKFKGLLMTKIFMFFLNFYTQIIPISGYVEKEIKNKFNRKKLKIVYNGIEDKFEKYNISSNNENLKIITISVLNKRKNVINILNVLKTAKEREFNIICNIIGNGPEKKKLETFSVQSNINNNITFLGEIPRKEVFEHLENADAFVLSSKSEGLGLVVIEAMMMGKPVIVKNIPVMKEIVNEKTGFLVNTDEEFFNALVSLKNDNKREIMAKNSREKYILEFSIYKMVENYEEIYKKFT